MCGPFVPSDETYSIKEKPEVSLAREFEKNLGLSAGTMDPVALRLFLLHRWSRVTVLAHAIHDGDVQ